MTTVAVSSRLDVPAIATRTQTSRTAALRGPRLAYLVSHYPAISHTFIFHEIQRLRAEGVEITTISINACDRPAARLPAVERPEHASTLYVKPAGVRGALRALVGALWRRPRGVLRGLAFTIRLGGTLQRYFYFIEAVMVGRWMQERQLTHLHIHFGQAAATVGMLVARTFPVTYSVTIHGPDEFYNVREFYLGEKVASARFVCCIGAFARSQIMKVSAPGHWRKLHIVPLGVDPEVFVPTGRSQKGALEVLCIGRLVPAKGQHVLLSAVKRLIDEGRSVHLRLLGDGPDRQGLEERIAVEGLTAHVTLEGAINQDRIPEFLSRADVFALASFAEGIPVSLMEAMASEIPCISTTIAGIPELIRHQVDGLLVPPSDEDALASALRLLLDDPEVRQRLGRAGRLRVIDRYNLQTNVKRLAEVYRCQLP